MANTYSDKATSYLKSLDNLERQVDARIGFQVDDDYVSGLYSRLKIITTKVENTRQQFKKDVTKLVTKNVENKQNVLIRNWGKTEIDYPRISQMDDKIKMINELKKRSQMSIPESIKSMKTQLIVRKENENAEKKSFMGRRNEIYEMLIQLEKLYNSNKVINNKSKQDFEKKIINYQKSIDKLFLDFKTNFQKLYTTIMNSNRKSKMVKTYSNFYTVSNSQPWMGSKTKILFRNQKLPTIDRWDSIIASLKSISNKPIAGNKRVQGVTLLKTNYKIIPIIGDGSCQFKSIARGMKNSINDKLNVTNTAKILRNTAVSSLQNRFNNNFNTLKNQYVGLYNPTKTAPKRAKRTRGSVPVESNNMNNAELKGIIQEYITKMQSSCEFGDDLTLAPIIKLLKDNYNTGLVILSRTAESNDYYNFIIKHEGDKYIYLLLKPESRNSKGHYDLLSPIKNNLNKIYSEASKISSQI